MAVALHKLQFDQDLDLLKEFEVRIKEDEKAVAKQFEGGVDYGFTLSVPGIGPILGAVILSEVDRIAPFRTAKKLLGYAGLAPTTPGSGGKTYHGKMIRSCNKWLKWAFVEAAWVAVGCDAYFGGIYRRARDRWQRSQHRHYYRRLAHGDHRLLPAQRAASLRSLSALNEQNPGRPVISWLAVACDG